MRHGSLFSGIGGFDLAAEWMGWENVFHCEWNSFGQRVLHHYWPNAETFTDITKTDFTKYHGSIDIISGGFPCQPYSAAGKRRGKEDERHLWPEMCRAIREISPSYVVGENVRGLTNWNGGMVFDEVCAELESIGYQVAPVIIPACAVNAPHKRERIWFVATNTNFKRQQKQREQPIRSVEKQFEWCIREGDATDSKSEGSGGLRIGEEKKNTIYGINGGDGYASNATGTRGRQNNWLRKSGLNNETSKRNNWENFPTQSPICGGDDGLPNELDGITFSKWRNESIKAYGNAIVPQVAYEIFKAIEKTV